MAIATSAKIVRRTVRVDELTVPFYVRTTRDDDRTLYLAELYSAGRDIPPPRVTEDLRVIDGRNRLEAHRLMDRAEILVEVVTGYHTDAELIAMAFNANVTDAPLPPTVDDCIYVIEQLIDKGVGPRRLPLMLPSLPLDLLKKYMKAARSRIEKRKIRAALADVADGHMSAAAAAQRHGIDIEKLRKELKRQAGDSEARKTSVRFKGSRVATGFRSLSQVISRTAGTISDGYEVGEYNEAEVREFYESCLGSVRNVTNVITDHLARFNKKVELIRREEEPVEVRLAEAARKAHESAQ